MIQSVLLFILGFLSAGLLALLLLPAVWKRSVSLTRRGIEASLPTTVNELNARIDMVRAQNAVDLRRAELQRDEASRKANSVIVDASRRQGRLDRAVRDKGMLKERLAEMDAEFASLKARLAEREQAYGELQDRSSALEASLADHAEAMRQMQERYDAAAMEASVHEVEAAARQGEADDLKRELLRVSQERAMVIADVDGPEAESARSATAQESSTEKKTVNGSNDPSIARLQQENVELLMQLAAMKRAVAQQEKSSEGDSELRETMLDLAAQMVNMAAQDPRNAAPIAQALAKASQSGGQIGTIGLADRIKNLSANSGRTER